jgi:putative transposase
MRQLRQQAPDTIYHLGCRGTALQSIFEDETDRLLFLRILDRVVREFKWTCHSYCLMNSHYHLILQTSEPNVASGMQYLNGVYSQRFNKRHGRIGHLMEGRYWSRIIDSENYFYTASRYIVLNPVRAGICERAADWMWSSYCATAGFVEEPGFLHTDLVLQQPEGCEARAREAYIRSIEDETTIDPDEAREAFDQLQRGATCRQARQLEDLFVEASDRTARNTVMFKAYSEYGLTMTEIGALLGIHQSTVSRAIERHRTMKTH